MASSIRSVERFILPESLEKFTSGSPNSRRHHAGARSLPSSSLESRRRPALGRVFDRNDLEGSSVAGLDEHADASSRRFDGRVVSVPEEERRFAPDARRHGVARRRRESSEHASLAAGRRLERVRSTQEVSSARHASKRLRERASSSVRPDVFSLGVRETNRRTLQIDVSRAGSIRTFDASRVARVGHVSDFMIYYFKYSNRAFAVTFLTHSDAEERFFRPPRARMLV